MEEDAGAEEELPLIRIKRKRTDPQVESLLVESEPKRPRRVRDALGELSLSERSSAPAADTRVFRLLTSVPCNATTDLAMLKTLIPQKRSEWKKRAPPSQEENINKRSLARTAQAQKLRFEQVRQIRSQAMSMDRFQNLWDSRFKYVEVAAATGTSIPVDRPPNPPIINCNLEEMIREYVQRPLTKNKDEDFVYDLYLAGPAENNVSHADAVAHVFDFNDGWAYDDVDSDDSDAASDDSNSENHPNTEYPEDEDSSGDDDQDIYACEKPEKLNFEVVDSESEDESGSEGEPDMKVNVDPDAEEDARELEELRRQLDYEDFDEMNPSMQWCDTYGDT